MLQKNKIFASANQYILLLVVTFFLVIKTGYFFMASNQTQNFLKVFSRINPNFAPNDWYVWKTKTNLYTYTTIIYLLHKFFPLERGVFGTWLFFEFLFILAVYQLAIRLIDNRRVFFLAVVLILFSMQRGWGNFRFWKSTLDAGPMGSPFFIISLSFMLTNNFLVSGLSLGLGGLIHAQYGIAGALIYGIYFVIKHRSLTYKKILSFCAGFLIPSSYSLISNFKYLNDSDWSGVKIYIFDRVPHHYVPSAWGIDIHIRMLLVIGIGIYCAISSEHKYKDNSPLIFCGIILFLSAFVAFFTEVYFVPPIVMTGIWRISPILMILSFIYGSNKVLELIGREEVAEKFWGAYLLLLYLCLSYNCHYLIPTSLAGLFVIGRCSRTYIASTKKVLWLFHVVFMALVVFLFYRFEGYFSSIAVVTGVVIINEIFRRRQLNANYALSFIPLPFLIFSLAGLNPVKFNLDQIHPYKYCKYYEEVLEWVPKNTKPEDNFIIPPWAEGFRVRTGRGILVNWKSIPWGGGDDIREWKERMRLLYPYKNLTPSKVRELAQKYKITYFLAIRPHKNKEAFLNQGFKEVFQNKECFIYKIL